MKNPKGKADPVGRKGSGIVSFGTSFSSTCSSSSSFEFGGWPPVYKVLEVKRQSCLDMEDSDESTEVFWGQTYQIRSGALGRPEVKMKA